MVVSSPGTVTLLHFLLARFDEDKAAAQDCAAVYPPPWDLSDRGWVAYVKADAPIFREVARLDQGAASEGGSQWTGEALEHIARWDPARVLAECGAKERIVRQLWAYVARPDPASSDPSGTQALWIVRTLATPYAEHRDFRPEWRS